MATPFLQEVGVYVGPSPVTLERSSTDVVVANTVTETDLVSYTPDIGAFSGDHGLRVTLDGHGLNDSTGFEGFFTLRVKLGATAMWESVSQSVGDGTGLDEFTWRLQFEMVAKDDDALQELFGTFSTSSSPFYGTATEDATTSLDVTVTVELDFADPDFTFTLRRFLIEQL